MLKITNLKTRVIFNSRGEKTIESEVFIGDVSGRFSSPSGASVGVFEAPVFPTGGITEALNIVEREVKPKLIGFEFSNQEEIDKFLREIDGTENYSKLGSSVSLSISMAAAEAASKKLGIPLYKWILGEKRKPAIPIPLGNVVGGGKHAGGKACDIQEFLAFPLNAKSFRECVSSIMLLHKLVGRKISNRDPFFMRGRNDEGAWVTTLPEVEILSIMEEATSQIKEETGVKFGLGIDFAATSLWSETSKMYVYSRSGKFRTRDEQIDFVLTLIKQFNLLYVEDPLHDKDFEGFKEITKKVRRTLICGDDLYVTSVSRLMLGTREKAGNCVIIKPNQVGDLTGSEKAAELAGNKGFKLVASHRSGETPTRHLAHIAVGFATDLIKAGIVGGERVAKLNELIRIEEELGEEKLVKVKI